MKHHLRFKAFALGLVFLGSVAVAQNNKPGKTTADYEKEKAPRTNLDYFDEDKAIEEAKKKNMPAGDIPGYVKTLKQEHADKLLHDHSHQQSYSSTIYLSPQNSYCTNAGFELYNFNNWTGSWGTVSTGPIYTPSVNAIANGAGNNVSLNNTTNYHTIMTTPPVQPIYPNTVGWDSIAVLQVGANLVSQIPVVNPNSGGGVSARMNGALANYRACDLSYNMALNPNNKRFTYSFAVVLYDGGHAVADQPFFQVTITDQNGNPVGGSCGIYNINATLAATDTSFKVSAHPSSFNQYYFRPWRTYSIDLSGPAYAAVTAINVKFSVAGCGQGGHWAYAYVDADCGAAGATASLCNGATTAVLVAPPGYVTYQWIDPFGNPVPAPQGTNDSLTVNGATPGMVYTVNMTTPNNCTVSLTTTISVTSVSITGNSSTPSCQNGNSGSATVNVTGSNFPYVFQWHDATGALVGTAQTATGLSPGTYSVTVTSGSCGTATGTVQVGISPPSFYTLPAPFCGNLAFIPKTGGTNYQWFSVSGSTATPIPAPAGVNDTLYVSNALNGDVYVLTYTNPTGCRDSIRYVMNQIPGGNVYTSSLQGVCPGSTNGVGVVNLQTTQPGPFVYGIVGPNGFNSSYNGTAVKDSLTNLAPGTYSVLVNDGVCFYQTTFDIDVISTTFTATPSNSITCILADTALIDLNFGAQAPTSCGVTATACNSPNLLQLFNQAGLPSNGTTNYPTPYGNWYTYGKQQFLVTKAELNAAGITAGKISSLAFKVTGMNSSITNYPNFYISMGCTNKSNLSNAYPVQFETGLTQVYANSLQPISMGWTTHTFQQSFVWDGTTNIVVEVCFGMNSNSNYSQNVSVELKQTSYTASIWSMSDTQSQCPQSTSTGIGSDFGGNPAFNTLSQYIPNMRFGYCQFAPPASAYTITSTPGTYTLVNSNNQIQVAPTFTAPPATNTVVTYTITVINPIGGCVADTVVSILYPSLNTDVLTSHDTTVCEGTTLPVSAWNAATFSWTYGLGSTLVPIGTTPTVYVTPPAIGVNTYYVNGTGYCSPQNDIDTVLITVKPKADLLLAPLLDAVKCLGKPYTLSAVVGPANPSNPGSPYYYSWTDYPSGTPSAGSNNNATYDVPSSVGTSTYVVTVNGACAHYVSDTVVVTNLPNTLTASILDSTQVCAGSPFSLNSSATNGYAPYSYNWILLPAGTSIGGGSTLSTNAPTTQGTYQVQLDVSDTCGYVQSDVVTLVVLPSCDISIPNVITPNGDGNNETFAIKGLAQHPNTALTIFDRWGRKVYESDNYQNDWKGDGVSDGTFFYVLKVPNDDKNYSGYLSVFHGK